MKTLITEYKNDDITEYGIYSTDNGYEFTTKCKDCGKEVTESCDTILDALQLISAEIFCNEHYVKNFYWDIEFEETIDNVTGSLLGDAVCYMFDMEEILETDAWKKLETATWDYCKVVTNAFTESVCDEIMEEYRAKTTKERVNDNYFM